MYNPPPLMDFHAWLLQTDNPAPAAPAAPTAAPGTTQAPADGAPAPAQQPGWVTFLPFILMFVVFYFLLLRPQKKQQREREAMISSLKKNDHVLTNAGIYGIVKQVQDNDIVLCIDENKDVRVKVARSAIAGLVKSSGGGDGEPKPEAAERKT